MEEGFLLMNLSNCKGEELLLLYRMIAEQQ